MMNGEPKATWLKFLLLPMINICSRIETQALLQDEELLELFFFVSRRDVVDGGGDRSY